MNSTLIIGRISRDVELAYLPSGTAYSKFTLAVNDGYGEKQKTYWIDCVAWNKTAENLATYCKKGSQIAVSGRLTTNSYENKEGQKRKSVEVMADRIDFLDPATGNRATPPPTSDPVTDSWDALGREVDPRTLEAADTTFQDEIPF